MKTKSIIILLLSGLTYTAISQTTLKVTDANTPLHAMQPDYKVPYGPVKAEEITSVLNRIFDYLDVSTPSGVIDRKTKAQIINMNELTPDAIFEQGVFRLVSYEWGVAYGAMLLAGEATADSKFRDYTLKRMARSQSLRPRSSTGMECSTDQSE